MHEPLDAPLRAFLRISLASGDAAFVADVVDKVGPSAVAAVVDEMSDLPPPDTGKAQHDCLCQVVSRTWQRAMEIHQHRPKRDGR